MSRVFAAPLFAVPCVDVTRQRVYVAVEDNYLYAFNSTQLTLYWKLNVCPSTSLQRVLTHTLLLQLQAPLFSSPVVTSRGTLVIGGVNKLITAVSVDGTVLWQHKTEGPVFSSPAQLTLLGVECVACGCHDGNIYCIDVNGALKWQKHIGDKPIFSSAFVGT